MIDAIIRWSLEHRWLMVLGAVLLVLWGSWQAQRMPVDVFPDLTAPTVSVLTEAHGMAPEEVEALVTGPVEAALRGAGQVRRVRSATSVGISVVWVEFDWGTDIYRARQIVAEKLQTARASLPSNLEPPVLAPISSIMGEVLFIGLTGADARLVRTIADRDVRRRLMSVPGVSQVVPIGGEVSQLQVQVRPEDLRRHAVSLREVWEAVRDSHENTTAGALEQGGQEALIFGLGGVEAPEDVAMAVVRAGAPGRPALRVLDVADVLMGPAMRRGDAAIDGAPGVVLGIQKQPGANTLELTGRIDGVLNDVEGRLPPGVTLRRGLLRQADFIETAVRNVTHALRDGSLLVILIVGIFLMSARATLITALAIPLSLVVAVLVLQALGATLNTMTLGGMAIAVGALVDDAIIDVENVARRLRGRAPEDSVLEVVFLASKEIRSSIVFATLIILLVFVPLFFLSGVEGRLLEPLGLAYVVSLAASLVVALTVTPALCVLLLPNSAPVRDGREPRLVRWLRATYERALGRCLGSWRVLMAGAVVGVGIALAVLAGQGRAFLPEFHEGALTVSVVTAPGTTLEGSGVLAGQVVEILRRQPEVVVTSRRTGRAELDEHAQGVHASEIDVRLRSSGRPQAEMLREMRAQLGVVRGANVVIGGPIAHRIDHMLSGTRANVAVKLFGPDLGELRRLSGLVRDQMSGVAGVVDLAVEEQTMLPQISVRFDRSALARHGLRVREVAETIETAFYGKSVARARLNAGTAELVVRYPERARRDLRAIRETRIPTPNGAWVPLEALARITRDRGPNTISREDGERKLVVMCNVASGRALGDVVEQIRARVRERVVLGQGYRVEYGGQFEAAEEASRRLLGLGALVLAGILGLLYAALGSWRDTVLVMVNLPLALIGGVVGVGMGGGVLSVASIIGFIALFGIATRNGIMLVTHIRHLREHEGVEDAREAVLRGASERLAPILMTALASGLGLAPLAWSMGSPGSEIQAPMALVILCGLVTSTALNMFVVPAVMLRFGSVREG